METSDISYHGKNIKTWPLFDLVGGLIVDLPAVNGWVETETKGIQCALIAKVDGFGALVNPALLAHAQLVLQEQFEELHVIEAIAACFLQGRTSRLQVSLTQTQLAQGVLYVRIHHVFRSCS